MSKTIKSMPRKEDRLLAEINQGTNKRYILGYILFFALLIYGVIKEFL